MTDEALGTPAVIGDLARKARHRYFVGRITELELFRQGLVSGEPPFVVLYLFGPGGVGKSALLREYARLAAEQGRSVYHLDGRYVEPSPQGFLRSLAQLTGPATPRLRLDSFDSTHPAVLLLDSYERITALDHWLRETFLPSLPAHVRVVIAGRQSPSEPWRTDPAWREMVRIVSLRNLRPEESRQLLVAMHVPASQHEAILGMTYGHPLALVLVGEWLSMSQGKGPSSLKPSPDVVRRLVERFVEDAPTPQHRRALEICSHVQFTTEAMLAELLGEADGYSLFHWLRNLSFIEQGPHGIFPHDLVRDVIDADLRWRNPAAYRQMHRQIRLYFKRLRRSASEPEQQRLFVETIFMDRHQPLIQGRYDYTALERLYIDRAREDDLPGILQMVARHEGKESAQIARYWYQRKPQDFRVFRSPEGTVQGFVAHLFLDSHDQEAEDFDPAMRSLWLYVRSHGTLRPGERVLYTRFWMGWEVYQDPLIHTLVATTAVNTWLNTPRLRWSFVATAKPDFWQGTFTFFFIHRITEADFTVDGRTYGVFNHDWLAQPVAEWMDAILERETQEELQLLPPGPDSPPPLMVLSQPEFAEAVRQALKHYHRPDTLAHNPLLRSRLLRDFAGPQPGVQALHSLLRQAIEGLQSSPKDEKFYRALDLTYLRPAPTQELAAERLGLPFNTYRYHLSKGVERVIEWLWHRELYGPGP